ncbi:MAG: hypothetical protein J5791_10060 [Fibrobacter sp.]|nr:hypothetical protein [Fibrobacter sp.]
MNLFKFAYAACLMLFLGSLCLMGCSDGTGYSHAGGDAKEVEGETVPGDYALKNREFIVYNKMPVTWFTADSRAVAYALDSSLNVIDSVEGSAGDAGRFTFRFPEHDYLTPYVKIKLNYMVHIWMPVTAGRNVWLETITDLSEVTQPRIDLMTHLDVAMVKDLVMQGYSFSEAKKRAMQDVAEAFHFTEQDSIPAEVYARRFDEVAGVYAFLIRSQSDDAFITNLKSLRNDLQDGELDDADAKRGFAEYVIKSRLSADSMLNKLDTSASVNKWKFFEKIVEESFGLPSCEDRLGEIDTVENNRSTYHKTPLVCDAALNKKDSLVYFRRLLSSLEKEFGACIPNDSTLGEPMLVEPSKTRRYKCLNEYSTYGISKDSTHMVFKNDWVDADAAFVREYHLGKCNSERVDTYGLYADSVYKCRYNDWNKSYYWQYWNNDTLNYYLGDCDTNTLWNLGMLPDSSEYVCTHDYWTMQWRPANDITKFLSQQPKCNRETDAFRSFSYIDLFYYVCDDVEIGGLPAIYTFKDTTSRVADSLAFIAMQKPCDSLNSHQYAYDTASNRFYHCETRDDKFRYYEVDEKVGRQAMCELYVKTLDACTAESDTTDIIDCPYNVTKYESTINVFYHCSEKAGKYSYEQVDYWDLNYYASLKEARTSKFCDVVGDTLQYMVDDYDYYYYCAKKDDAYYLKSVDSKTLANMVADEYLQTAEPCNETDERWRWTKKFILDYRYNFVCDYDSNANFVMLRVDDSHLNNCSSRKAADESALKLKACTSEQIAARGTPVEVQYGYITDPRDEHRYRVVTIGKQTWMAENLNYYDPDAHPNMADPRGCSSNEEECEKSGRLYYWYAATDLVHDFDKDMAEENLCTPVQGICPAGWHIPTVEEWSQLFQYVSYYNNGNGYGAGLRSESGWRKAPQVDDQFRFTATPVAWTTNENAYFMASDVVVNSTTRRSFGIRFVYDTDHPTIFSDEMTRSYSVRCVKD